MGTKNSLIGIAGVHLVAAELAVNGIIGTVTSRNTEGIDLLASRMDGLKNVGVQVKTSTRKDQTWMLGKKAEVKYSDDFYYVFVELKPGAPGPEYFVLPSRTVARLTKARNKQWLKEPGKNGRKRRPNSIRNFWFTTDHQADKYRRRWDLLPLR
jgi:hypothetical protein